MDLKPGTVTSDIIEFQRSAKNDDDWANHFKIAFVTLKYHKNLYVNYFIIPYTSVAIIHMNLQ